MEGMTCVCVWLGWCVRCWGEWVTGWGLGFTNSEKHGESGICVCVLVAVVWVVLGKSGWAAGARV